MGRLDSSKKQLTIRMRFLANECITGRVLVTCVPRVN